MTFIAMNRFKVRHGHEEIFEDIWRTRESRLKEREGFREFRLLKGPDTEEYRLYSSHTVWADKADFDAWTQSEQFRDAHKNAGNSKTKDALMGPPEFEGFESVVEEA